MPIDEEAMAEAILGKDAEQFLASELGRAMVGIAQQEGKEAMDELMHISAADTEKIRELQGVIRRSRGFEQWLNELAVSGQQAIAKMESENGND